MKRRVLWVTLAVAALVGGAVGFPVARAGGFGAWLMRSITPKGSFAEAVPPPPPDYRLATSWSALPEVEDLGDRVPPGATGVAPAQAQVDVFYVHSTSSVAPEWNASADDPKIAEASDRGGVLIQASAFNGIGAIYAPRYRQATGTAYYKPSADGEAAIALAYSDIDRAFTEFLSRRSPGRPLLLAGHSQGAALIQRLLVRRISGSPLRDQLVGAWIIGSGLTHEALKREAPDIPACAGPTDVGCVVAWNARSPENVPGSIDLYYPKEEHRVCTNPLSGVGEGGPMPANKNLGAVFLQSPDPEPRPGLADAACIDGTLRVHLYGKVPRDFASRILDGVMGKGNYHPIEFELFWSNIRANASERVAAWESKQAPGPQATE